MSLVECLVHSRNEGTLEEIVLNLNKGQKDDILDVMQEL
jgi:hypothetical protein